MHSAVETSPVCDLRDILQVVDGIYAAACGETGWDRVVAEACQSTKLDGCALVAVDPLDRRRVVLASRGLGPGTAPGSTLHPMPLLTDDVLQSTPGAVWQDRQIMAAPLLATTRLWTDWMQPRGFVSWACVIVRLRPHTVHR